jgi:hypothetical protein
VRRDIERGRAEAERIDREMTGARMVRALLDETGLHAIVSDGRATFGDPRRIAWIVGRLKTRWFILGRDDR